MNEDKVIQFKSPGTPGAVPDVLTEVLREGARQLLTPPSRRRWPPFWNGSRARRRPKT